MKIREKLEDFVANGRTTVAIKNSKLPRPNFGFMSAVIVHQYDADTGLSTSQMVGQLLWQRGGTNRQPPWGSHGSRYDNQWDVFGTRLTSESYDLTILSYEDYGSDEQANAMRQFSAHGIALGKSDGTVRKLVCFKKTGEALVLPNGTTIPPAYEPVTITLEAMVPPCNQEELEQLWELIPFNNGGGPGSERNPLPEDLYERELVSYWAAYHQAEYRELVGQRYTLHQLVHIAQQDLLSED